MSIVILSEGSVRRTIFASRPLVLSISKDQKRDAVSVSASHHFRPDSDWGCVVQTDGANRSCIALLGTPPVNVGDLGVGYAVWSPQDATETADRVVRGAAHDSQVYYQLPGGFIVPCFDKWTSVHSYAEAICTVIDRHGANQCRATKASVQNETPWKTRHNRDGNCFLPVVRLTAADGNWTEGYVVTDKHLNPVGVLVPGGDWQTFIVEPVPNGPLCKPCFPVGKADLFSSNT